jgi:hypothetical protein
VNNPRHERTPLSAFPQKLSIVIRPEEIAMVINESKTRLTPQFYKYCLVLLAQRDNNEEYSPLRSDVV